MTCNANLHMPLLMCGTKLTMKILAMSTILLGGWTLHAIGMLSHSNSYLDTNVNEKYLDTLTKRKKK